MAAPTPEDIRKQVHASAELEVAKKLKVLLLKKIPDIAKNYTSEDYLKMAKEAIGEKGGQREDRKVTLPGTSTSYTLKQIDEELEKTPEGRKQREELGAPPSQLVPTYDELDEVAMVSARSVKKATNPLAMIMNFITAFFQTLGDFFSGHMDGKGFFERIKEHAAENAGNTIGDDMRTGLNTLMSQKPEMRKWLDVDAAVKTVKHGARVAAGVDPRDPDNKAQLELDAIKPEDVMAGVARKRIRDSVAEDVLGKVKGAVGAEESASTVTRLKSMVGLQATAEDATKITDKITDAVTNVMTKEEYNGKKVADLEPDALKAALKDETRKALQEYQNGIGSVSLSFKPTNAQIEAIVGQMDGYVDKNYQMLKDMGKQSRSGSTTAPGAAVPLPSAPAEGVKVEVVRAELRAKFEATLKPALVEGLNAKAAEPANGRIPPFKTATNPAGTIADIDNDPFIQIARERFIEKGTLVISRKPWLMAAGREQELSDIILRQMMATEDADHKPDPQGIKFKEEALAKMKLVSKQVADMKTPGELDLAYSMLPSQVLEPFTKFFKNEDVRNALLTGVTSTALTAVPAGTPIPDVAPATAPLETQVALATGAIATSMETAFADNKPTGKIFNALTGVANAEAKTKMLKSVAEEIVGSGVLVTPTNPAGMLRVKGSTVEFTNPDAAAHPGKAFDDAKRMIADNLKKNRAENKIGSDDLIDAIAERTALEMVNKGLAEKGMAQIDVTQPENRRFVEAQARIGEPMLAQELKKALEGNTWGRNLAAVGGVSFDPKAIAESAAKALAPLAVADIKDASLLKEAVKAQLASDGVITDAGMLDNVSGSIATGLLEKTAGRAPTTDDRQRNLEEAFALAQQKVGAAIGAYKEGVKKDMEHQPIWLAPKKFPKIFGLQKIAEKSKRAADTLVRGSVSTAVEVAATTVDEDLLKKTIAGAAMAAAQGDYEGRQFFELSDQEKKDAVATKVREALENDKTFWKIFPGELPVKLTDRMTKVDVTNDVKALVIDKIVAQVHNNVATPPTGMPPLASAAFQPNAALPTRQQSVVR